ncbi:MAG: diadenosine tetraphosphate hydrolase [Candidatus Altiarchaeales archaeon ex4484_2]|nr:MAG: diadenosine tetraphosphate hydrolase [Candidatus Altiarchaeales archaeon ex4484_2]
MVREKSCGAVIYLEKEEGRLYLLLNYAAGHWDFPKGHVEGIESEKDTVLRELEEETGIREVSFTGSFREVVTYFFQRRGDRVDKVVVFYLLESGEENVVLSNEHISFKWLPYIEAREKLTYGNARNLLDKAEKHLNPYPSTIMLPFITGWILQV